MQNSILSITCPHCQKDISLDEALTHQIQEQASIELKQKHKKELEEATRLATNNAIKKTAEEFKVNVGNIQKEMDEEKERNKQLTVQISELLEEMRKLRRKDEERDIEMKKKILEEEDKIRLDARKKAEEEQHFKLLEKDKQLQNVLKEVDELKRKAQQGSQQNQGEVLELDLEKKLRETFIYDEINDVGKGKQGADIIQKVKNQTGKQAGIILWETKRASWSSSWLPKLREDGRREGATMIILVSETLPKDIKDFGLMEGVLVVSYTNALSMAAILRRSVMQIASAKFAATNKDEKLERLYAYLQSDTFRHRFEAFAEGIREMENDLGSEERAMQKIWGKRKMQIERMRLNSARMYGELQDTMGNALPDIKTFELPEDTT